MKLGNAPGSNTTTTLSIGLAPIDANASEGPGSTSYMASAKKRAQNPMVSTMIVNVPAKVPSPTEATKKRAQAKSGTVLKKLTIDLVTCRTIGWGEVFRAASTATGMLIIIPMK